MVSALDGFADDGDLRWENVLSSFFGSFPFWWVVIFGVLAQVSKIVDSKLLAWWVDLFNYSYWRSLWQLIVKRFKQRFDIRFLNFRILGCSCFFSTFITYAPVFII